MLIPNFSLITNKFFKFLPNIQENVVNSMDFSKDGELLITASDDETMILYDTVSGVLVSRSF